MPLPDDISDIGPQYYPGSNSGTGSMLPPDSEPPKEPGDQPTDSQPSDDKNPFQGWDEQEWARHLKDPGDTNAANLEYALSKGWITPDMAKAAQIIKDASLHHGGGWGGGMANNSAWQGLLAKNQALNSLGWETFMRLMGTPWEAGYSETQPTLSWNPAALPQQYRQAAENWFKQQGLTPTGSIGQYGYTQFQRQQGQPYKPISVEAFGAIPDEQLRQWMLYLGSAAGLIPGNYQRPTR